MQDTKKIFITFEKDPLYRRISANGIWGGVDACGQLVFDLVEDLIKFPDELTVTVANDSGIVIEEVRKPEFSDGSYLTRLQRIGVTMPMNVVPGIIQWLQDKVAEYENSSKNQDI